MASTTALLTGLSGLNAHSRRLEVIGNNISNVNTTAFKSARLLFSPSLSRNISLGTTPSAASGGTNPGQIGLGVSIAGTQRNFTSGALSATGISSDLAIEGDGFFIVERAGQQFYTRAGSFQLNSERQLVTQSGARVQGYSVDNNFNVIEGGLVDLEIPIGTQTLAEATENVTLAGNLNAGGDTATQPSITLFDQAFVDVADSVTPLTGASLLVDVDDPANAGTPLFADMQTIRLSGVMKGDRTLPDADLVIDAATTTVQDLIDFIEDALGIVPGQTYPDGSTSGVTIDGAGVINIVGNIGEDNSIMLEDSDFRLLDTLGVEIQEGLTFTQSQAADGESVTTTAAIFDSLGTRLFVDITMVFESADSTGTTWRYYIESDDDTDVDLNVGTGTVSFDNFGRQIPGAAVTVSIDRLNTGAVDPLVFNLNLDSGAQSVTALSEESGVSTLGVPFQDGVELGILSNYSVGDDGVITGGFTNGQTRVIGQVVLATFSNPEGLVDSGDNLFVTGPNSGAPLVTPPLQFGAGRVVGGALELSNVDLGAEFINMILTTTGYSASSRVISTTDQLLQLLVNI
ncbi:MAG: flagellar hook-basal body complex protein [Phycisphaeraceae bacterium]|nr:flagellar hook-basal body complex protein [Phycisphaeraceae bacterium]